jgi:hypothetical protein
VVETAQKKFGGIMVGDRKLVLPKDCIPRASQQKLFEEIMKKPGASLKALREVANELLLYRNRVPDARLRNYIRRDCPQFITEQMIKAEVRRATSVYRDAHLVDMHLGKWMYSKKIEISTYLTDENRLKLMYLTPDELHIEGLADPVDITYSKGHPYIIGKPQVLKALAGKGRPLMIGGDEPEDRVEVMVQLHDSVTKKKKSVSAATL